MALANQLPNLERKGIEAKHDRRHTFWEESSGSPSLDGVGDTDRLFARPQHPETEVPRKRQQVFRAEPISRSRHRIPECYSDRQPVRGRALPPRAVLLARVRLERRLSRIVESSGTAAHKYKSGA